MPKKVLPTEQEVKTLLRGLEKLGFDQIGSSLYMKNIERLGLQPPRTQEGREISFSYFANNYEVVVHTTLGVDTNLPAEQDAAWVLIRQADEVLFYSPRLHRTKNFVSTLLLWAEIAQTLVKERPLCPECKAFMHLRKGKKHPLYTWLCTKTEQHERSLVHSDSMMNLIFSKLSSKAQKYLKIYKSKYVHYQKELVKKGLQAGKATQTRKKWRVSHPNNLE